MSTRHQERPVGLSLRARVERLERIGFTGAGCLAFCFAVTQVRVFLEAFSDSDNLWSPVPAVGAFIHYPMFFAAVLLAFALILRLVTGEEIGRVTRVLVVFFPIILVAPLADLLLSAGRGFNMTYLFGDARELWMRFLTFGGLTTRGATPGIRLELIAVFVLLALYGFAKTGSPCRAAGAVAACYVTGFVLGALPSIVVLIWPGESSSAGPSVMAGSVILNHFYSFDHKTALIFFPVLVVEAALWWALHAGRTFGSTVRACIPADMLHFVSMLGIGMLIGATRFGPVDRAGPFPALILMAAVCAVAIAWSPWATGCLERPRESEAPARSGDEARVTAAPATTVAVFALALGCAWVVRYAFLSPLVASVGVRALCGRFGDRVLLRAVADATSSAIICLAGFILFSPDYSFAGFPCRILAAIVVGCVLGFAGLDLSKRRSTWGIGEPTRRWVPALVAAAYLTVPPVSGSVFMWPPAVLAGGAAFVVLLKRGQRHHLHTVHALFLAAAAIGIALGHVG